MMYFVNCLVFLLLSLFTRAYVPKKGTHPNHALSSKRRQRSSEFTEMKTLLSKVMDELILVNSKQDTFINVTTTFMNEQNMFNKEQSKKLKSFMKNTANSFKSIENTMENFSRALGRNFEAYNAATIILMANIEGLNSSSMLHSKVFEDPEGLINPGNKQFDVDIFCEKPLVIVECTSHVVADELKKIRKFPHIVRYLEKKYNGTE